jgi:hypothetical protein
MEVAGDFGAHPVSQSMLALVEHLDEEDDLFVTELHVGDEATGWRPLKTRVGRQPRGTTEVVGRFESFVTVTEFLVLEDTGWQATTWHNERGSEMERFFLSELPFCAQRAEED